MNEYKQQVFKIILITLATIVTLFTSLVFNYYITTQHKRKEEKQLQEQLEKAKQLLLNKHENNT